MARKKAKDYAFRGDVAGKLTEIAKELDPNLRVIALNSWHINIYGGKTTINFFPSTGNIFSPDLGKKIGVKKLEDVIAYALRPTSKKISIDKILPSFKQASHAGGPVCPACSEPVTLESDISFIGDRLAHKKCADLEKETP
jgi:hypothetical protein